MNEQWQELKETIIEMRDNNGTGTQQEVCKFLANLMDVLEKQMQEPKTGHWISVSERVPKEYGEYLVTWTGILGENKRTRPLLGIAEYEIYEPENYEDWITTVNEFEHYRDIKVSAWMPLPKPYEPQESEDKE